MTEDILVENEDLIERIAHSPEVEERRKLIKELVESIPMIMLKKIEQKKAEMERLIKEKNTDCVDIDIQPEHKDLLYWDEMDKTRVIKSISFDGINDNVKNIILKDINSAIGMIKRQQ